MTHQSEGPSLLADFQREANAFYADLDATVPALAGALYLLERSRAPQGTTELQWETRRRDFELRVFQSWRDGTLLSPS